MATSNKSHYTCRRATNADILSIQEVLSAGSSSKWFDTVSLTLDSLLELQTLSIVLIDSTTHKIVGFASATDQLSNIDTDATVEAIQSVVADTVVSTGNSLFLSVFGLHPIVTTAAQSTATHTLIRGIFSNINDMDHLLLVPIPYAPSLPDYLTQTFMKAPSIDTSITTDNTERDIYLCPRQSFVPTLYVRSARVEDNDDLAPIFTEVEAARFGEFYLAEVMEKQTEETKVLVGEGPEGRAVGLMAITNKVPISLIQACFDTAPFGHLTKRSNELLAADSRTAQLHYRTLGDWYTVLSTHGDELQNIFDSIPSATVGKDDLELTIDDVSNVVDETNNVDHLLSPLSPDTSLTSEKDLVGFKIISGENGNEVSSPMDPLTSPLPSSISRAAPPSTGYSFGTSALDSSNEAEEEVLVADVANVFDSKGDAWGYVGIGGAKLGHAMLVDTGILPASTLQPSTSMNTKAPLTITRSALNALVASFADRRDALHRRMRVAAWYNASESKEEETIETETKEEGAPPVPPANAAQGKAPAPVAPVAHGTASSSSSGGPLPGRKLITEEMDKLSAALDQSRKERVRSSQQAVTLIQKEIEAAAAAERAAQEAAAKEAYDKAHGEDADGEPVLKKEHAPSGTFGSGFLGNQKEVESKRKSIENAEARLEKATNAVAAAQTELLQPLRISLATISAAVNKRFGVTSSIDGSTPGDDLVAEIMEYIDEATANVPSPPHNNPSVTNIAPLSPRATAESVGITKLVVAAAMDLWEKRSLPCATAPVVVVTSSNSADRYTLVPVSGDKVPLPTKPEQATATNTAAILQVPHIHIPSLLSTLADSFAAAEIAVAAAIEKMRVEEEKRKKKEEEDAKKALASAAGGAKKDKKKEKKEEPKEYPTNTLVNPQKDPLGAIQQYIQARILEYSNGFVLSGVPMQDNTVCQSIATMLRTVNCPAVLNLHVEEGVILSSDSSSSSSSSHLARHLSVNASERMFAGARRRRDSIVLSHHDSSKSFISAFALTTYAGAGAFGSIVRMEGIQERLVSAAKASLGRIPDNIEWNNLVTEPLISTLLREGVLRHDPTEATAAEAIATLGTTLQNGNVPTGTVTHHDADTISRTGVPNAFQITLFCLAKQHETRFLDLLTGAFEAYPDREFAILTQPFSTADMPMLRRFTQVLPLPQSTLNQTLYICHRDSLLAPTLATVRRATSIDRPAIASLVASLPDRITFMDAVIASERRVHLPCTSNNGKPAARIATFVTEVEGQVVAVAVLGTTGTSRDAIEAASLSFALDTHMDPSAYYNAENSTSTSTAALLHVCFNPIFLPATPSLLRTATRLFGGRKALIYRQPISALGQHLSAPLPPVIRNYFGLVAPRIMPELNPMERAQRAAAAEAAREEDAFSSRAHATISAGAMSDGISYAAHRVAGMTDRELSDPRNLDHALYVLSSRSSSIPKTTVNSRVVIVGASDAAIASVASFILTRGNLMPHITLLSPGGLPQPRDAFTSPASFTPGREFTGFELSRLPIASHVRVMDDLLVRINRKERTIGLGLSRAILKYDRLLLLPGLTESTWGRLGYDSPDHLPRGMHCMTHAEALASLAADVDSLATSLAKESSSKNTTTTSAPNKLGEEEIDDPTQIVVYGDTLEALTAINALLDRGIPGPKILHLRPYKAPSDDSPSSGSTGNASNVNKTSVPTDLHTSSVHSIDSAVEETAQILDVLVPSPPAQPTEAALFPARAIAALLDQTGVRQVVGAELLQVEGEVSHTDTLVDVDGQPIVHLPGLALQVKIRILTPPTPVVDSKTDSEDNQDSFGSDSKEEGDDAPPPPPPPTSEIIRIRSSLLLCCDKRDVDPRFFKAVNDCGIVYDGRLVVDHRFIATDPSVFGGGSIAKFSRRYRAPHPLQRYDSREVGAAVATAVLTDIENGGVNPSPPGATIMLSTLLPRFSRPKTTRALLPGSLYYVSASLPEYDLGGTGREIVTHVDMKPGVCGLRHCRLLLSRFKRVAELTYIGTDPVEGVNLAGIVGHSSAYLNGLERRADAHELIDIIAFLRQGWASALYHDRFGGLLQALRGIMSADPYIVSLQEKAETILRNAVLAGNTGSSETEEKKDNEESKEDPAASILQLRQDATGVNGSSLPSESRQTIEKKVLAFLADNNKLLPSYLIPGLASI